jgi:hypothetical protein
MPTLKQWLCCHFVLGKTRGTGFFLDTVPPEHPSALPINTSPWSPLTPVCKKYFKFAFRCGNSVLTNIQNNGMQPKYHLHVFNQHDVAYFSRTHHCTGVNRLHFVFYSSSFQLKKMNERGILIDVTANKHPTKKSQKQFLFFFVGWK